MHLQHLKKYAKMSNYTNVLRRVVRPRYKKSYAQTGEDLIIKFIFDSLGISKPTYIDIGAHDPFKYNNTALLYEHGSRGINIEPNPVQYKKFLARRKRDLNLNIGISDAPGVLDFYVLSNPALSTFSREEAQRLVERGDAALTRNITVPVETVSDVLREHLHDKVPDLLSIDTESLDETILRSIDFTVLRPKVICVETISYSPRIGGGVKDRMLIDFVASQGYHAFADTSINTIFVDADILADKGVSAL